MSARAPLSSTVRTKVELSESSSSEALWLVSLVLPYLLFMVHNRFHSLWLTSIRAVLAVACGWAIVVAYAQAALALSKAQASSGEALLQLNDGDGAKLGFAATLGWVLPTAIVGGAWAARMLLLRFMLRPRPNKSLERTRER
jgi:hypothetical protein